jgi:hypothetical protein
MAASVVYCELHLTNIGWTFGLAAMQTVVSLKFICLRTVQNQRPTGWPGRWEEFPSLI